MQTANKLIRDIASAEIVEMTIVIPLFLLLALGTIDVAYMFYDWALANKATYIGARAAVVTNPVAPGVVNLSYPLNPPEHLGENCFDGSGNVVNCPIVQRIDCTGTDPSGGSCTNGYAFDNSAFTCIFNPNDAACTYRPIRHVGMQQIFPILKRSNVRISYETNGLGFVGQPYPGSPDHLSPQFSLPMNVTVTITGVSHPFFFLSGLANWSGFKTIPNFTTTMQSEDMTSN